MINTGLLPLSLGIFMMILHGIALMHTDKINPFDLLNKPVQMYQIQLKKPKTSPKKPIKKPQPKPIKKPPPKKAPPKQPPPPSKKTASIPSPNIQETPPPTVHATQLNQAVTPIQPILPQYPEVAKKAGIEAQLYVEVIIDEKGQQRGTRVFGPVPRELKENYAIVAGLASEAV